MEHCAHLLTSHAYLQEDYSGNIQHSDETTESQSKEYDELLFAWDSQLVDDDWHRKQEDQQIGKNGSR